MGDGGKWVCGLERIAQQDSCVVYSFGINNESSFEAALLRAAPRCQVWGYDFSVPNFGPEITEDPDLRSRSHFRSWGLGSADNYGPGANPPFYTLQTLMAMNGHSFIDVLKVRNASLCSATDHVTEGSDAGLRRLTSKAPSLTRSPRSSPTTSRSPCT